MRLAYSHSLASSAQELLARFYVFVILDRIEGPFEPWSQQAFQMRLKFQSQPLCRFDFANVNLAVGKVSI